MPAGVKYVAGYAGHATPAPGCLPDGELSPRCTEQTRAENEGDHMTELLQDVEGYLP